MRRLFIHVAKGPSIAFMKIENILSIERQNNYPKVLLAPGRQQGEACNAGHGTTETSRLSMLLPKVVFGSEATPVFQTIWSTGSAMFPDVGEL